MGSKTSLPVKRKPDQSEIPDAETYRRAGQLLQALDILLGIGRLTLEVRPRPVPIVVFTWSLDHYDYRRQLRLEAIDVRNLSDKLWFAANQARRMLSDLNEYLQYKP